MNVGIVGCGLIGQKRAAALAGARLVACADVSYDRAQALAARHAGAAALADWRKLVALPEVEIVVVATPHDQLPAVTLGAVQAGKHVLVEKPAARSAAELQPLVALASQRRVVFKAGFNYRFHPAIRRAADLLRSGEIGTVRHLTARHGHGGRKGLEKEWRADPGQSGGGQLLDQGVHLVDLLRWLSGEELASVQAVVATEFWPTQPLEDTAFCLFRTTSGVTCSLLVSLLEWKNRFELEITGDRGALRVEGLGGSYGPERLTIIRRPEQFGVPQVETLEFENPDECWAAEWAEFVAAVREGRAPLGDARDSLAVLRAVEACYRSSREQRSIAC